MVSASKGAEKFYSVVGHQTRSEDLDSARGLDTITADVSVPLLHYILVSLFEPNLDHF